MFSTKKCNHKNCYKCGHLFETGGKEIIEKEGCFPTATKKLEYCGNCAPKYDSVIHWSGREMFFKKMRVDEDGEPIGYRKIVKE